ncbi:heme oxygenase-like protein, partial [Hyaloscypha hepaticicola]
VNIATRSVHSQLNRLILVRLPLALPPCTSSPSIYAYGLLHIAPIYITFESIWQAILDSPHLSTTPDQKIVLDSDRGEILVQDSKLARAARLCPRVHSMLFHLRLPGLLRSQHLRADIRDLTRLSESEIQDQLEAISRNGKLAEFITHTRKAVQMNPHIILAYAWVFYMALFSGGRYLRAALVEAGGEGAGFWKLDPSPASSCPIFEKPSRPWRSNRSELEEHIVSRSSILSAFRSENGISRTMLGLQFFHFHGEEDGEDIKVEFKKRFVEAEALLSCGEKESIIAEAKRIFSFMVEVVLDLDMAVDAQKERLEGKGDSQQISMNATAVLHGHLLQKKPLASKTKEEFKLGIARFTKNLGSAWTKLLTSLVPMVLCIILTFWYYGL